MNIYICHKFKRMTVFLLEIHLFVLLYVLCTHFVHRYSSFPFLTGLAFGGFTSSGMLHGAVSSLLPTSNQRHTTSLNSEDLTGTAAEGLSFVGLFLRRQIPDCRVYQKNYTNITKYFSQPFSMRLGSSHSGCWRFQLSVMWHCMDWHHTYIPMYIVLYTRRLEYWPFSMFIIPTFRSSFYSGFHYVFGPSVPQKQVSV